MRLLQNLLITDNDWFFENLIFELEVLPYSIRMGLSLAKPLMLPEKMFVSSAKFTVF